MSTPAQLYTCPHCGANLSLDQLRGTDCPYCRSAFPHHARAVEHAALVNQVMAQNMAAYNVAVPVPTHLPMVHVGAMPHLGAHVGAQIGAQMDAMRRLNSMIGMIVAISIAAAVGFTIVCAVALR